MPASYPGSIKTFTTKTNKVDLVDAAHVNDLQAEVVALETELAADVAGTAADLKSRLAISMDDDGSIRKGTAFPTTDLKRGQLFYRTDEDRVYYLADVATADWRVFGQVITQVNDTDTGTTIITNTVFLSVNKTVAAGKTIILIASGSCTPNSAPNTVFIYLYANGVKVQTVTLYFLAAADTFPWAACAVVTGLSGTITFEVMGWAYNDHAHADGNLIVIEM